MSKEKFSESSDLLTIKEVAEILRVDGTTIRRWITQGLISSVLLPHANTRQLYRVKRSVVETIMSHSAHVK